MALPFNYEHWESQTLHPEDAQAFRELLGGIPGLSDLLQIEEEHLKDLRGKTPGVDTRVWKAIECLQKLHEFQRLESELAIAREQLRKLEEENKDLKVKQKGSRNTQRVAFSNQASTLSLEETQYGDTWDQDFQRLEGVLTELKRLNSEYPVEEINTVADTGEHKFRSESIPIVPQSSPQLQQADEKSFPKLDVPQQNSENSRPSKPSNPRMDIEAKGTNADEENLSKYILGYDNEKKSQKAEAEDEDNTEDLSKYILGYRDEKGKPQAEDEEDLSQYILGGDDKKDPKEELNPEDFIVKNLVGQLVVRKPGEIMGQSFAIHDLKNCTVVLFDNMAQIQIDDCNNCIFYVGPCEGSAFIRTCQGCKVIVSCAQFRTRECKDCDVLLHCSQSQPIIESSTDIRFGPFDGYYVELTKQLEHAKMSPWDTEWTNVHDFNPPMSGEEPHWKYLPLNVTAESLIGKSIFDLCSDLTPCSTELVPRTWGNYGFAGPVQRCFVLLGGSDPAELGYMLIKALKEDSKSFGKAPRLIRSRTRQMQESDIREISDIAKGEVHAAMKPGLLIGAEFGAEESSIVNKLTKVLAGKPVLIASSADVSQRMSEEFFGALRSMSG